MNWWYKVKPAIYQLQVGTYFVKAEGCDIAVYLSHDQSAKEFDVLCPLESSMPEKWLLPALPVNNAAVILPQLPA